MLSNFWLLVSETIFIHQESVHGRTKVTKLWIFLRKACHPFAQERSSKSQTRTNFPDKGFFWSVGIMQRLVDRKLPRAPRFFGGRARAQSARQIQCAAQKGRKTFLSEKNKESLGLILIRLQCGPPGHRPFGHHCRPESVFSGNGSEAFFGCQVASLING